MNVREYGSVQQPMLTCFRSRKHGYRIKRLTVVRESQQSECELPHYISSVTNRYQSPPILRTRNGTFAETRDMEVGHAENSNECYKLASSPYYVVTDLDQGRSTCTPRTLCLQWLLRHRRGESSGQVITKRHSDVIVPACTCNLQPLSYAPGLFAQGGLASVQGPRGIVLTQLLATSSSVLLHQLHLRLTSHDVDNAELCLSVSSVSLRTNLGVAGAKLNSW